MFVNITWGGSSRRVTCIYGQMNRRAEPDQIDCDQLTGKILNFQGMSVCMTALNAWAQGMLHSITLPASNQDDMVYPSNVLHASMYTSLPGQGILHLPTPPSLLSTIHTSLPPTLFFHHFLSRFLSLPISFARATNQTDSLISSPTLGQERGAPGFLFRTASQGGPTLSREISSNAANDGEAGDSEGQSSLCVIEVTCKQLIVCLKVYTFNCSPLQADSAMRSLSNTLSGDHPSAQRAKP